MHNECRAANICSTWQMAIQRRGNPLDQLLLPIQLGADEALILLVNRTVELARRRWRRILLRRLQRGCQPLPLSGKKQGSKGTTLQLLGVSHAGGGVIAGAQHLARLLRRQCSLVFGTMAVHPRK